VAHPVTGQYNVTFPGSSFNVAENVVPVATLIGGAGGPDGIGVDTTVGGAVIVQTFTTATPPAAADGSSALIVFDSSATG
jgi:hypothetical protein